MKKGISKRMWDEFYTVLSPESDISVRRCGCKRKVNVQPYENLVDHVRRDYSSDLEELLKDNEIHSASVASTSTGAYLFLQEETWHFRGLLELVMLGLQDFWLLKVEFLDYMSSMKSHHLKHSRST